MEISLRELIKDYTAGIEFFLPFRTFVVLIKSLRKMKFIYAALIFETCFDNSSVIFSLHSRQKTFLHLHAAHTTCQQMGLELMRNQNVYS